MAKFVGRKEIGIRNQARRGNVLGIRRPAIQSKMVADHPIGAKCSDLD